MFVERRRWGCPVAAGSKYSGKTILIRGYQGEPYLRFDKSRRVPEPCAPPPTYPRNRVPVPIGGRSRRRRSQGHPPVGSALLGEHHFAWSDHRIHWTSKDARAGSPAAARRRSSSCSEWRVPGTSGRERPSRSPASSATRPPPQVPTAGPTGLSLIPVVDGRRRACLPCSGCGRPAAERRRAPDPFSLGGRNGVGQFGAVCAVRVRAVDPSVRGRP